MVTDFITTVDGIEGGENAFCCLHTQLTLAHTVTKSGFVQVSSETPLSPMPGGTLYFMNLSCITMGTHSIAGACP